MSVKTFGVHSYLRDIPAINLRRRKLNFVKTGMKGNSYIIILHNYGEDPLEHYNIITTLKNINVLPEYLQLSQDQPILRCNTEKDKSEPLHRQTAGDTDNYSSVVLVIIVIVAYI